jgi:hypothetical protein
MLHRQSGLVPLTTNYDAPSSLMNDCAEAMLGKRWFEPRSGSYQPVIGR